VAELQGVKQERRGRLSHLALEFLILFVVLPAAFAARPFPIPALPILWVVTAYCYLVLRRHPQFEGTTFWSRQALAGCWRPIVTLFVPVAAALTLAVRVFAPALFLNMPRRNPLLWAGIMIFYPLLSVIPQTLVYRAFLFERYRALFCAEPARILASAAAFAWLHIALRNWLAPLLTLPAGLLFAWRYSRTRSVLASAFEHALYGCVVFTLGLGAYFYTGAAR
jgi:membrane protease YdiL (CAAX protease family)